jgi:hypothetical protein
MWRLSLNIFSGKERKREKRKHATSFLCDVQNCAVLIIMDLIYAYLIQIE